MSTLIQSQSDVFIRHGVLSLLAASIVWGPGEADGQTFCPPARTPQYPGIEISAVSPQNAAMGELIFIEGRNLDQLPPRVGVRFWQEQAPGSPLGSIVTADTALHVVDATYGVAVVPAYHVDVGAAEIALVYTGEYDCSSQGGSATASRTSFVNFGNFLNFEIGNTAPHPRPPSHVRAAAVSHEQVRLQWRDNSNNEQYFEVYFATGGPSAQYQLLGQVPADTTSEPINGLEPQTTYCFEVRSVGTGGTGMPLPDVAKACATTLPLRGGEATVTIQDVPGYENSMCAGTFQGVPAAVLRDTNGNGIIDVVGDDALAETGPAHIEPAVDRVEPPFWEIYTANRYAPGADAVLLVSPIHSCGLQDPQFIAVHFDTSTLQTVAVQAGNNFAATLYPGTNDLKVGVIMFADDTSGRGLQEKYRDSRLYGYVGRLGAVVAFDLEVMIEPSVVARYQRQADLFVDLGPGGVPVVDS